MQDSNFLSLGVLKFFLVCKKLKKSRHFVRIFYFLINISKCTRCHAPDHSTYLYPSDCSINNFLKFFRSSLMNKSAGISQFMRSRNSKYFLSYLTLGPQKAWQVFKRSEIINGKILPNAIAILVPMLNQITFKDVPIF